MRATAITAAMIGASSAAITCTGTIKTGGDTYKSGECKYTGNESDGSVKATCISDTKFTWHHHLGNNDCSNTPVQTSPYDEQELKDGTCTCTDDSKASSASKSASISKKSSAPNSSARLGGRGQSGNTSAAPGTSTMTERISQFVADPIGSITKSISRLLSYLRFF